MGTDDLPHRTRRIVKAACPHDCPDTCALDVTVENGVAIGIAGSSDHPFTEGTLCTKVSRYLERTYHYLQRVGVEAVRAATVDAPPEEQAGLLARFALSKSRVREPWSTEGAAPRTPLQFGSPCVRALPTV